MRRGGAISAGGGTEQEIKNRNEIEKTKKSSQIACAFTAGS
jgi:hypothetical protein